MTDLVFNKEHFGTNYKFMMIKSEEINFDLKYLNQQKIDSFSIALNNKSKFTNIDFLREFCNIRGLILGRYNYFALDILKQFSSLEYLNFLGKSENTIPFEQLKSLWCIYLNYDQKTCDSIFECRNLEYIFIDNYAGNSSKPFESFVKAKRIGLFKSKIFEFETISHMPNLEHIGIGYNLKMKSIAWLKGNTSLKSIGFHNCKNIADWKFIGDVLNIEKIHIENCGEIASLEFLSLLPNLQEVRITGTTNIKDGKIKKLMKLPNLKFLFVPVKKDYDVTLSDLTQFNNQHYSK